MKKYLILFTNGRLLENVTHGEAAFWASLDNGFLCAVYVDGGTAIPITSWELGQPWLAA